MKATRWAVIVALGIAACGTQEPTTAPDQTPTGVIDPVVEPPAQQEPPREANVLPEASESPVDQATPSPSPSVATPAPTPTPTPRRSGGGGGGGSQATPTPSPTASVSATPTPTPTPSTSPSPSPTPSKSPSPSPTPSKSPSPSPTPTPTPTPKVVSFSSDVVPILTQHCAQCHKAGGIGSGAVTMFSETGSPQYTAIKAEIASMIQAIEAGQMPLGEPGSVPDAQVNTLDAWRDAGAPNN